MQKNKKSLTQMPGDSKRQRADTNLTRAQEERLFRESEAARKEKLREERNERNPPTAVERGIKRGLQKLKKAVGLKSGGKLNMVTGPNGKMVPDYATDGVGKMSYGGKAKVKKMNYGGKAKVKKMGYGGGVKKMSPGGKTDGGGGQCRGMGAATSGGKFKMG